MLTSFMPLHSIPSEHETHSPSESSRVWRSQPQLKGVLDPSTLLYSLSLPTRTPIMVVKRACELRPTPHCEQTVSPTSEAYWPTGQNSQAEADEVLPNLPCGQSAHVRLSLPLNFPTWHGRQAVPLDALSVPNAQTSQRVPTPPSEYQPKGHVTHLCKSPSVLQPGWHSNSFIGGRTPLTPPAQYKPERLASTVSSTRPVLASVLPATRPTMVLPSPKGPQSQSSYCPGLSPFSLNDTLPVMPSKVVRRTAFSRISPRIWEGSTPAFNKSFMAMVNVYKASKIFGTSLLGGGRVSKASSVNGGAKPSERGRCMLSSMYLYLASGLYMSSGVMLR
mmetsp:Transcript_45748/g.108958  ORF Transcript_45748/g.108958 Transcript_45748/m.108958 type:complete len:334 (-) Transcript_45748:949-1950(-)